VEGVDQGKAFAEGQIGRRRVGDGVVGVDEVQLQALGLPLQDACQGEGVEGPWEDGVVGQVHGHKGHGAFLGKAEGPFRGEEVDPVPHPGEPFRQLRGHDAASPKPGVGHQAQPQRGRALRHGPSLSGPLFPQALEEVLGLFHVPVPGNQGVV
jgi:hypothetical protein